MWSTHGQDSDEDPLRLIPDRLEPVEVKVHDTSSSATPSPSPPPKARSRSRTEQIVTLASQHLVSYATHGGRSDAEAQTATTAPLSDFSDDEELKDDTSMALGLRPAPLSNTSPPMGRPSKRMGEMPHDRWHAQLRSSTASANHEHASGLNINYSSYHAQYTNHSARKHDPDSAFHYPRTSQMPDRIARDMERLDREQRRRDLGLASSIVGTHIMYNAPTPEQILRPYNPEASPSDRAPYSPGEVTSLPSITPLIIDADNHQKSSRQRQRSLSGRSSISATSPDYAFSSSGSPLAPARLSPTLSHEGNFSPRHHYQRPSFSATSPPYVAGVVPHRGPSQSVELLSGVLEARPIMDYRSASSNATSPETAGGSASTTPGDTSLAYRSHYHHDFPIPRHSDPMPPPRASPIASRTRDTNNTGHSRSHILEHIPTSPFEAEPKTSPRYSQHPSGNQFKCDFEGCDAQPFSTQYLLNSHKTVHSELRPHYCSVQGCSRSVTGQGFKRKNEMIRHQLVHESPGYICPYCPSREHRYPRPDNLLRHVKAHHRDVPVNDDRLRVVLDRKQSGRSVGRKKKSPSTQA